MPGCSGGVELPGWVVLPGGVPSGGVTLPGPGVKLLGAPGSGGVGLPGSVVLPGVPGSGGVGLPGAGVKLPGAPGSGGVTLPGLGVKLPGAPGSGGVTLPAAGVLSGVVLLGALGVAAVPPGQRELSGKYSQRIFIPSGDILISAGELVASLVDWAIGDLLDWPTAMLAVSAKDRAVPIMVRDFPIILKLTSTEHSPH